MTAFMQHLKNYMLSFGPISCFMGGGGHFCRSDSHGNREGNESMDKRRDKHLPLARRFHNHQLIACRRRRHSDVLSLMK